MKAGLIFTLGIAVGSAFGWFIGYVHPRSEANRNALEYVNRLEPEYVGPTILALSTIPLIESGETNKAIELLSDAIADYYRTYASAPGTNEYRRRAGDVIEARALTNQILAARLEHKMTNQPLRDFHRVWIKEWKDYVYLHTVTNSATATGR